MLLGHMVYFTLKDASPAAVNQLIQACRTHLTGHEGVVLFAVGTLVPDLAREVNQRDFHVALQLVFESRAAHDRYQTHERHQRFIAENRGNWEKVKVYDADVSC